MANLPHLPQRSFQVSGCVLFDASRVEILLTLDTDWAPDHVVEDVGARTARAGVRATWFATNDGDTISRIANDELNEVGIHPNFGPNSSHGTSPDDVLDHCLVLFPHARSMRTHALVQSTHILSRARAHGVANDVSMFVPDRGGTPFALHLPEGTLIRVEYAWEDDFEMFRPEPSWDLQRLLARARTNVLIMNFHPIHVYLNSSGMGPYRELCRRVPSLLDASSALVAPHRRPGPGTGSLFDEVLSHMQEQGRSRTVAELASTLDY